MHLNIFRFFIFSILILFQAQTVLACRFNVRETGFVDLGDERYFLVSYVDDQTPDDIINSFGEISKQILRDSNIEFTLVNVSKNKDHPALQYLRKSEKNKFPQLILISQEGQSLNLEIETTKQVFEKSLKEKLTSLLSSPFREKLQDQLIDNYGVVLVIEGSDNKANEKARFEAQTAVKKVTKKMDLMPKAIKGSPQLMVVNYKDHKEEALLFWILGLAPRQMNKTHAVIFYGRSRWLGPLFRGEEITTANLSEILFVVGADCECGLDKNWLRGTTLPMIWDKKAQAKISENLGFDPENPMIKIEVSRIMRTEHFRPSNDIPAPDVHTRADSTDMPRKGIGYDNENAAKTDITVDADSSHQMDGSLLSTSVIVTVGILALLFIVGSIIIFRRSKNNT